MNNFYYCRERERERERERRREKKIEIDRKGIIKSIV
jgi:hypothetical protein